jgi:glycosyltransferase involved in cell wall biosynthesis
MTAPAPAKKTASPSGPRRPQSARARLSVIVLTKDSADTLGACLASLAFADQVIVIDSGSRDASLAIARAFGATIRSQAWKGYTAQRNFGLRQCKHPWVLSVDSDEVVTPELAQDILGVLAAPLEGAPKAYQIPEKLRFFRRWLRHGGIYPGYHVTLFQRAHARYGHGPADVHEGVQVAGPLGRLNGFKLHHAYPSFGLALSKLNRYTSLEAQGRWDHGVRPSVYGLFWRPLERFLKNYFLKLGFLDGLEGFLYCYLTAHYSFVIHVKLYELQRMGRVA